MVNKARTSAFGAGSVTAAKISAPVDIPKISSIAYSGDDTATNTAGGDTITVNGSFFKSGCFVYVDTTKASVVSFISSTQITFTAPAKSAGTYTLYVYNPDGGTAIYIPGINYSGTPTWSTASGSIGTAYETVELSSNVSVLSASSNSTVKYRLYSGSLPTNAVLNTDTGAITGVTASVAGATTYTFVIEAYDLENQGTLRTFSITLNPDVVTWSSPADGTLYNANVGSVFTQALSSSSATGRSITYTANTLPAGLSISGSNITGTPTAQANTTSLITAISATTSKTATRTLLFYVKTVPGQPTIGTATAATSTSATVTFTAPAYDGNSPITQYIATSSPGNITGTLNQAGSGTVTVSGLTAGTNYTFTVKAVNAAGQSVASTSSNQISTASVPGAPTIGTVSSSGITSASVPFTAPASNGGLTITSYTAVSSPGGITGTLSQAGSGTITVSGLTTGTNYSFTVYATNSLGNGPSSGSSNNPIIMDANAVLWVDPGNSSSYSGSGTTWTDLSGKGVTGTLTNGPTFTSSGTGSYLNFDANNDYVSFGNNGNLNFGTGDFTVNIWMYPTRWNDGNSRGIIDKKSNDGSSGWTFYCDGGQPSKLNARLSGSNNFFSSSIVTISGWQLWTFVRSGSTIYWYKNSTLDATGSTSANLSDSAELQIGHSQTWNGYYEGRFGLVNAHNRALSSGEITTHWNLFRGRYGL